MNPNIIIPPELLTPEQRVNSLLPHAAVMLDAAEDALDLSPFSDLQLNYLVYQGILSASVQYRPEGDFSLAELAAYFTRKNLEKAARRGEYLTAAEVATALIESAEAGDL